MACNVTVWLHKALSLLVAAADSAWVPEWTGDETTLPVLPEHVHGASEPDSKPPLTTPLPLGGGELGRGVGDGDGGFEGEVVGEGVGDVPLVNGSKVWLNCHVDWEIPEQLSAAGPPGQLPLSRCSANFSPWRG